MLSNLAGLLVGPILSSASTAEADHDRAGFAGEITIHQWVTAALNAGAPYSRRQLTWALNRLIAAYRECLK